MLLQILGFFQGSFRLRELGLFVLVNIRNVTRVHGYLPAWRVMFVARWPLGLLPVYHFLPAHLPTRSDDLEPSIRRLKPRKK